MQEIINGDCLEVMKSMDTNSIDFVVCDPPYGLKFMGKSWDHGIPGVDYWQEVLRVCKPGSMLAAFGGTRTYHRLTCAIEDAGWQIRDCVSYLYGSGFPKSHNKFGIDGYGTALKPAWEPIIIAMKPLEGTYKQNVEKWGLGGINIDASRIQGEINSGWSKSGSKESENLSMNGKNYNRQPKEDSKTGRWPANLILDEEAAQLLDEQSGFTRSSPNMRKKGAQKNCFGKFGYQERSYPSLIDSGGASRFFKVVDNNDSSMYDIIKNTSKKIDKQSTRREGKDIAKENQCRFFYCAKASKSERNAGLEGMPIFEGSIHLDGGKWGNNKTSSSGKQKRLPRENNHPTVKPLSLMRYIITLLAPPGTPTLLDPFAGSGSTLCAAKQLGINAVGIELDKGYCEISEKRVSHYGMD